MTDAAQTPIPQQDMAAQVTAILETTTLTAEEKAARIVGMLLVQFGTDLEYRPSSVKVAGLAFVGQVKAALTSMPWFKISTLTLAGTGAALHIPAVYTVAASLLSHL